MINASKNKKIQLVVLILATGGLLGLIWSFLIVPPRAALAAMPAEIALKRDEIVVARRDAAMGQKMKEDLNLALASLAAFEDKMAQGDLYRWVIKRFQDIQTTHPVEFTDFDPPQVGELDFVPKLPYKAATFTLTGTGSYQEFGLFLADFENNYPHCRLQKLELEPFAGAPKDASDNEKITIKMEFLTLIKPVSTNSD